MPSTPPWLKHTITVYLVVWFVGSFWIGALVKSEAITHLLGVPLVSFKPYVYYGLAGAIGGTLYALRLFHEFYDRFSKRWVLYYLLRPITCAGAAVMTIILFQSGILLLQTGSTVQAKIGIAFLVGFGYGKVMEKLKTMTEVLFSESKEPRPPDHSA
ncbi:hypothetical protein [Paenibacillus sp. YYML68]|uniref:hypothetical protein n=1 Tax=Paenibacillus sp. YYML68 TaxID=2909250 RepID=UPI0024920985|nr:hypothetical protein [Paenibacillus sp. YYML68]